MSFNSEKKPMAGISNSSHNKMFQQEFFSYREYICEKLQKLDEKVDYFIEHLTELWRQRSNEKGYGFDYVERESDINCENEFQASKIGYNEGKESAGSRIVKKQNVKELMYICDEYDEYEWTPRIDDVPSNDWQPDIIVEKMRNYKKREIIMGLHLRSTSFVRATCFQQGN